MNSASLSGVVSNHEADFNSIFTIKDVSSSLTGNSLAYCRFI